MVVRQATRGALKVLCPRTTHRSSWYRGCQYGTRYWTATSTLDPLSLPLSPPPPSSSLLPSLPKSGTELAYGAMRVLCDIWY
eukprot:759699-Rhodomonas_salina.1